MGIDTGGGSVKLNGDDGVKVADVVLKESSPFPSPAMMTVRLTPGSHWIKDSETFPTPLTLLAVNTGEGFVAVSSPGGAANIKGVDVAMVFERPTVFSSNNKLYRTSSPELHIKGKGFLNTASGYKTALLKFSPPLLLNTDYAIRVVDSTEIEITLRDGHAWRTDAGPLQVVAVNTRGDEAGWVTLPGSGVHVAEIQEDIDTAVRVEVFPMGLKVYQSALNQKIQIVGTGGLCTATVRELVVVGLCGNDKKKKKR
eukprot:gene41476-51371_t